MISIIDELLEKLRLDPSLIKRGGPRQDLGLLLFSERESLNALWKAAARQAALPEASDELRLAVERLRPLFGERSG